MALPRIAGKQISRYALAPVVGLLLFPLLASGGNAYPHDESTSCAACHPRQQAGFERSRMAVAARTETFLDEWRRKGEPEACLGCHSPSGADGVICTDCHGANGHPYPVPQVPRVCARCHDAPGEITLQGFLDSPAARRGEDCLTCHLEEGGNSHDFRGPTRPGFLQGIATLRVAFRRDAEGGSALLQIRHRAGHALPGGTTGRSVWLLVEQRDTQGRKLDSRRYRFGWLHSASAGWRQNTLPPGTGRVVEVPLHEAAGMIRAKLVYRFRAGGLDEVDPEQVVLVEMARSVPTRAERER
ncbi:MAG: cytochrome c family protein [Sedimenticola sp.]|nr:cytochrome c family protein [Sedimenticola sp.]